MPFTKKVLALQVKQMWGGFKQMIELKAVLVQFRMVKNRIFALIRLCP